MRLVGREVAHKTFGDGRITGFADNVMTVGFSGGDRKFLYPEAFETFLTMKDPEARGEIGALLNKRKSEDEERRQALREEEERRRRIRTVKLTPSSQAAFDLTERELEEAFETGVLSTGMGLSGSARGKPRLPSRLKLNSSCLLTTLPEGEPERERRIAGAFMVRDDFSGEDCQDGLIEAHELYRLRLPPEERLMFWEYFDHKGAPSPWGAGRFKYFSTSAMQRILLNMKRIFAGSGSAGAVNGFYAYFSKVNRL